MLIIFDMDGVLIDARPLHFHAFNTAVAAFGSQYVLSWAEHQAYYDGLPTWAKLRLLSSNKGFPRDRWTLAWETKQAISALMVEQLFPDPAKREMLLQLKRDGHVLACASNSIRATVDRMLTQANLLDLFDCVVGNDEPGNEAKPNPRCFEQTMEVLEHSPEVTWIVEDSVPGLEAARLSGAHVIPVSSPDEVTYEMLAPHFWNVLIPMAGAGARFTEAGYTFPKPLIEVDGKPMIQLVVENLALPGHYIFLVNSWMADEYSLPSMLDLIAPGCDVVRVDTPTEGAACTALQAAPLLDDRTMSPRSKADRPLFIANCDQWVRWDRAEFVNATVDRTGLIPTFESVHPKWSYVEVIGRDVFRVAEKKPISTHATVGWYWWRHGQEFVRCCHRMIHADDRTNSEFYIAPTYNYIGQPTNVGTFPVEEMWGLGTPEDLQRFIDKGPS